MRGLGTVARGALFELGAELGEDFSSGGGDEEPASVSDGGGDFRAGEEGVDGGEGAEGRCGSGSAAWRGF